MSLSLFQKLFSDLQIYVWATVVMMEGGTSLAPITYELRQLWSDLTTKGAAKGWIVRKDNVNVLFLNVITVLLCQLAWELRGVHGGHRIQELVFCARGCSQTGELLFNASGRRPSIDGCTYCFPVSFRAYPKQRSGMRGECNSELALAFGEFMLLCVRPQRGSRC